jgi:hypothetical protein
VGVVAHDLATTLERRESVTSTVLSDALLSALATRWDPTRPRAKVAQMTWQANATATYRFLSAAAARAH